jgi:nucleotide-binding universal stress UspA family protein
MVTFPMAELEKESAARLAGVVDEIVFWLDKERFPALKVSSQVVIGFAAEEIATQSEKDKTDLIVMGTRGTGALEGMLLGSNTTAVLQRVTCPVLVIPADAEFQGFKKIVYASDMHEVNAKAIQVLAHFASHFAAEIHVLHIVTNKDTLTPEQADAYRKKFSLESGYVPVVYHIVDALDHSVAHAIESYIEDNKIDIVAMVTHHRSFFDKLFHPSITKKLAIHAKQPLLAFH